ncbi:4-oxalocrotonate tautomerase family protein [Bacillus sp. CGMCC 1.60114]|uniref:tautomerase family protein n=1 Tax=unclassified Bacillus (in: firmicutes) TaxID=185979 RepID=UPI00362E6406
MDESDWFMPDGWEEEKVFIEFLILPGRKKETKAKLLKEITEQVSNILKIDKNAIIITLHELSLDNWGFKGGQQASQIGVTFRLDV